MSGISARVECRRALSRSAVSADRSAETREIRGNPKARSGRDLDLAVFDPRAVFPVVVMFDLGRSDPAPFEQTRGDGRSHMHAGCRDDVAAPVDHADAGAGELVRITEMIFSAPGTYYLTWNRNHKLSPAASLLGNWIATRLRPNERHVRRSCGLIAFRAGKRALRSLPPLPSEHCGVSR